MQSAAPFCPSASVASGDVPPADGSRQPDGERKTGFHLGHRPVLDGLRGVAVLAVMAYHSGLRSVVPGGFLGVDLFFVLSGFLVTVLLLQEHQRTGAVHLGRFYVRRLLRLLPALFVMLAVCCVLAAFRMKPDRVQAIYQAALLTACQGANWDWYWSIRLDLLGHAWSLSLEAQFYLVWPVLLMLLLRFRASVRQIMGLVVLGMATAALLRAGAWMCLPGTFAPMATTSLPARADSLLAGCLVALLVFSKQLSGVPRAVLQGLAGVSAAGLLFLGLNGRAGEAYLYLGGFTAVAAATAVVLAALIQAPPRPVLRFLCAPVLVGVGRISYGLYLWHFPLLSLAPKLVHGVFPFAREVPWMNGVLAYAAAFGAAMLSFFWVERPFLRWKAALGRAGHENPANVRASGTNGCPAGFSP